MELEKAISKLKEEIDSSKTSLIVFTGRRHIKDNTFKKLIVDKLKEDIDVRETVLKELDVLKFKYQARKDRTDTIITKQEKMIELMVEFIDTELSSEHLSRVLEKEVLPLETYRKDIKQYFEKKAEEIE